MFDGESHHGFCRGSGQRPARFTAARISEVSWPLIEQHAPAHMERAIGIGPNCGRLGHVIKSHRQ